MQLTQGDTWAFTVVWANPLPGTVPPQPDPTNPVDLTGWTAKLQVREQPGGVAALALTSDPAAGLTVDGPTGAISIRAAPSQTETIPPGVWLWELEVDNTVDRHTVVAGTLTVRPQVTT